MNEFGKWVMLAKKIWGCLDKAARAWAIVGGTVFVSSRLISVVRSVGWITTAALFMWGIGVAPYVVRGVKYVRAKRAKWIDRVQDPVAHALIETQPSQSCVSHPTDAHFAPDRVRDPGTDDHQAETSDEREHRTQQSVANGAENAAESTALSLRTWKSSG